MSKQVNCAPATTAIYSFWLDQLLGLCEQMGLSEPKQLTPDVINIFLLGLRERYAPHSVLQAHRTLKSFIAWLVAQEVLTKNPMLKVERPRVPEKSVSPYNPDDVKRLLAGFAGHSAFIAARMRAMVMVFLDTGVRRQEMSGMAVDDVEMVIEEVDDGKKVRKEPHFYITVRADNAKTRVERKIRLGNVATAMLTKYIDARAALMGRKLKRRGRANDSPYLWLGEKGEPISGLAIYHCIKRECARVGITVPRACHAFRNTAAIQWLANGGGESTLMTMGGWKSVSMMRHYTKAAEQTNYLRAHRAASPVDNMKGVL